MADGELNTLEDCKFITRFCFLSLKGTLHYYFEYPVNYGSLSMLLYYDSVEQWLSVYKSTKNCTQRLDVINMANNEIITLDATSECDTKAISGIEKFVCSDERVFKQARERWWYIAVSHCRPQLTEPISLSLIYKIHMTNGPEGDYLHREYSTDEFYIQPINMAFLIAYVILSTLTVICAARAFEAINIMIFLLMLIVIGKGYTITCGKLSTVSTVKITVFMTLYAIIYVVIFIWYAVILTRPLASNTNFPYHVRTTQTGILQNAPHSSEDVMLVGNDSFSSHAYAPLESSSAPDLTIMFTTEKSRSMKISEDTSLSNNYSCDYTSSNGAKIRNLVEATVPPG